MACVFENLVKAIKIQMFFFEFKSKLCTCRVSKESQIPKKSLTWHSFFSSCRSQSLQLENCQIREAIELAL